MLQNIRDNIQGTAAKVIIGIIVIPFAFFGVDSLFSGSGQTPAAVVNGEDISEQSLLQAVALQKRRLIGMMGDSVDPAMLDDSVLRGPALNTLIKQQLLLQTADDANAVISDAQLNRVIVGMPQFQEDGRFSQQRYQQVLRLQGYSSQFFKELLRSDLLIQQLSAAISSSSFVTDAQLNNYIQVAFEERDYHYLTVKADDFVDTVSVSEEEIEAYYQQNSADYVSEEQVRFSYLELNQEDFYQAVDESALQREYERLLAASEEDVQREAAHILIEIGGGESRQDALKSAEEIRQRVAAGEDFAELAKQYSDDIGSAGDGGRLGFTSGDSFPTEFEAALAVLEEGEVSAPVETESGVHLIKLLSVRQPEMASFEEMKPELTEQLQQQQAKPRFVAAVEDLRDLVFNAEDLTLPAEEMELNVARSELLERSSNEGLFQYEAVKRAAFSESLREAGHNSEVIELTPERYVVLHVEEYKAPTPKPLEQVRDSVVTALKAQKASQAAAERAESIANALREGSTMESLAKQNELEWDAVVAGTRNDLAVEAPLRQQVFAMPKPEAGSNTVSVTQTDEGNHYVVSLLAVRAGQPNSVSQEQIAQARQGLQRRQASEDFAHYFNVLWQNADIKIN
ncbi:SurA N-terminal domain-containing protein [Spongiibacter nanhainus]|uniref:Periplasmic chaperone PpiD n=1 Tax=Spongiibacter nanhainus TaxID=2794344 RepID=A0A7T4URK0_9GAMM|nr:SurA N-terminal domain-containing protein [Spongiibacter nanhainus]QQD19893.1 SurA N-terminal domain-containing protein [Spongiibacter nanhainus]